jgi:hypothetical protein
MLYEKKLNKHCIYFEDLLSYIISGLSSGANVVRTSQLRASAMLLLQFIGN